jgi:hypothetical protein
MRLQDAQVKARFGHRDWLFWRKPDGTERICPKSLPALLEMQDDCRASHGLYIEANSGNLCKATPAIISNLIGWME